MTAPDLPDRLRALAAEPVRITYKFGGQRACSHSTDTNRGGEDGRPHD